MPLYPQFFNVGTLKAKLLASTYTFSVAHRYLDDVDSHASTGTNVDDLTVSETFAYSQPLNAVTMDYADFEWLLVTSPDVGFIVIYEDTGDASTSRLVDYLDVRDNGLGRALTNATITYQFDSIGTWKVTL